MTTDRELLELAAKAAGIDTSENPVFDYGVDWGGKAGIWNPLTYDGDALRLAVKLGLDLMIWEDYVTVCAAYASRPTPLVLAHAVDPHGIDPCSATRRAIVRAAAEIGRAMP